MGEPQAISARASLCERRCGRPPIQDT